MPRGYYGPHPKLNAIRERVKEMRLVHRMSLRAIAEKIGRTPERVRQYLKDIGVSGDVGCRSTIHIAMEICEARRGYIIYSIGEGMTIRNVAKEVGVSVAAVLKWLKEAGLSVIDIRRQALVGKEINSMTIVRVDSCTKGACICKCGSKWEGYLANVLRGLTKSCGCRRRAYERRKEDPEAWAKIPEPSRKRLSLAPRRHS